ncbi:EAL domain-containing protein [Sedimenticola selenatireducens]|uniref:Sensor protein FixL n=1 Tax=Sedimenticola selenatireducens TaxID=191960 RepID=A0A557SK43_9GAMM|nr:EAL domain-containing protein [Sedimenticola selenatireducens]TVO77804.1 EAL domain-containing protein [Sedimenticola selenatireducens]TVT65109.1 MAG: EAL domain-containing protein [Sedimenticola selenatireducens]
MRGNVQGQELHVSVTPIEGVFDPSGVLLSVIVAFAASYVAFSMVRRLLVAEGISRWYWYLGAAVALGGGAWTMHFIGMIALQLPFPVQYHKGLTLLSLFIAIAGSFIALLVIVNYERAWQRFALGSLIWTSVVTAMHFVGMATMVMPARMDYDIGIILLSVVISFGAAGLALSLLYKEATLDVKTSSWRFISAVTMGLSIIGIHYLAMFGTRFVPVETSRSVFLNSFESDQLLWPLAIGVLFILYLLMGMSLRGNGQALKGSIGTRLRVIVVVLVTVTGMCVGLLSVIEIDSILVRNKNEHLKFELEGEGKEFARLIRRLEDDVRFLSRVPGIAVLMKGLAAKNSAIGDVPPEVVKRRISSLFRDFLISKPEYMQIRLIGADGGGRQLIRAERQGEDIVEINEQLLQPMASEHYFTETLKLLPGVTYLSDIDFNREDGVVTDPRVMVIRIAAPIYFDRDNSPAGIVVIYVNLSQVFSMMTRSEQPGDRNLVTDQAGRLLAYRDSTLQRYGADALFTQVRYPFLRELFNKTPSGGSFAAKVSDGGEQLYVHLHKVGVSERYPDRELVMVEILPAAYIDQQLRPILNKTFIATLLLILLSIPVAIWLVRQIVNPLNISMRSIAQFAAGDMRVNFPTSDLHEISLLSEAFTQMREQVNSRELALSEAEARIRSVVEHVADGIVTIDGEGIIRSLNGAAERMFGYDDQAIVGNNVSILMPEPYRTEHDGYIDRFNKGLGGNAIGFPREFQAQHQDGHLFPIEVTISVVQQGKEQIFIGLIRDLTERQHARQQERLAAKVMETSLESIAITDAKNRIQYVNPAFCEITGYSFAESLGKNPSFLSSGRHDGAFYKAMWEGINNEGSWQGEIWDRRKDGTLYLKWLSITAIENSAGEVTHYVGIASDITERKQTEERLKDLAHHDQLTGLPNRQLFNDRLEHAVIQAARSRERIALLFIDLDRFKGINDTYGHDVGDKLLIEVANRIHGKVREGDTVARLGGDEFTVILPDIKEVSNAVHIAYEIIELIDLPVIAEGHDCSVGASIGIAFYPEDGTTTSALVRHADIAMYRAKSHSGSACSLFDKEMEETAARRLSIEMRLRTAIENGQFFLNYQPLIDIESGLPVSFEALIRWQVPGMGVVSPTEFIPLSEETGQIVEIGAWVLEAVCRQLADWRSLGLKLLPVAVNVSTRQLLERDFVSQIKKLLEHYQLDAQCIELELTETTLMKYPKESQQVLEECHRLGLSIAIDDFGTGYSSLEYLKQLPVNKLKIDRTFIKDLEASTRTQAIVGSVVHLAQGLEMQVVAEGVETPGQLKLLREFDCGYLQGYLFSRPVSAEVAAEVLSESKVYC